MYYLEFVSLKQGYIEKRKLELRFYLSKAFQCSIINAISTLVKHKLKCLSELHIRGTILLLASSPPPSQRLDITSMFSSTMFSALWHAHNSAQSLLADADTEQLGIRLSPNFSFYFIAI